MESVLLKMARILSDNVHHYSLTPLRDGRQRSARRCSNLQWVRVHVSKVNVPQVISGVSIAIF